MNWTTVQTDTNLKKGKFSGETGRFAVDPDGTFLEERGTGEYEVSEAVDPKQCRDKIISKQKV